MSELKIKTIEEFQNEGTSPEILFWVGCAGSFDDRAKRITKAFVKILNSAKVDLAVRKILLCKILLKTSPATSR